MATDAADLTRAVERQKESFNAQSAAVQEGLDQGFEGVQEALDERSAGIVTESARAHSYMFNSEVQKTCKFWLLTFWLLAFWLLTVPYSSIQCQKASAAL